LEHLSVAWSKEGVAPLALLSTPPNTMAFGWALVWVAGFMMPSLTFLARRK
jgi:hypothetical protein